MLTILGLGMIMCFMYLIMSKRLSALVALTLIPIIFALLTYVLSLFVDNLAGFDIAELGNMMMEGIKKLAPTGVMLLFAILYFAIMIDTGLFDPSVKWILKQVKGDPLKVTLGTITLTLIVSLDGDGSTTYMICVAAMLPLWGGPTARAETALHVDPNDVFVPMILPMLVAIGWLYFLGFMYGRMERKRIGIVELDISHGDSIQISQEPEANRAHLR